MTIRPRMMQARRPAWSFHVRERGPADPSAHVLVAKSSARLQIDDGEIGVEALGEPALVGQAEQPLRPMAGQVDEPLEGEAAVGDVGQHHRQQGLNSGHARGRGWIGSFLLLEGVGRVVGADDIDDAAGDPAP